MDSTSKWLAIITKKLERLHRLFPVGSLCWHKASGERYLVEGYKVCADMMVLINVTTGGCADAVYEMELSRSPVSDDEAWKISPEDISDDEEQEGS